MAAWIGVFRAYGDHTQALLELNLLQTHRDTLETLYSVLTSVLEEYRDVVSSCYKLCINNIIRVPFVLKLWTKKSINVLLDKVFLAIQPHTGK